MMLGKLKILCSVLFLTAFLLTTSLKAEPVSQVPAKPLLDHAWRKTEYPPLEGKIQALYPPGTNPRVYQDVDVSHYTIDAEFLLGDPYPDNASLVAETTIDAKATATLDAIVVDFYDNITIDDIWLNAEAFTNYTRSDDKIWMDLTSDPLDPEEVFEIKIDYNRVYGPFSQGLLFMTHGDSDTPAICSIDQPYGSPGWWPCFDVPYDKATAEIYITCPDWMTAVSNGLLQGGYPIDNGDGTKTFYWKEDYPLYTSVLSVAMTDYTTWTDTYVSPLDATEMPLVYYAFPEDAAKAMVDFDVSKDALVYFAQIYGEYPFIDEKYGVAETPNRRGSVEHQTITSLTVNATKSAVNWHVIVHEAAHQWWGDWVTCDTWNHIWLHEGFATYSEVLFNEDDTGEPAGAFLAANYDDGLYDGSLAETVYTWDGDLHRPFHDSGRIYDKGGWVLHMLRYIIDDDTSFFNALKTYGQTHAHSTAVTDDLKAAMVAEYGSPLDYFLNQWVYTPYRPIYSIIYENSSSGGYKVDINIQQTQTHMVQDVSQTPLRDYYIMPLDFTVHYTDETTETFTRTNDQRNQSFQLILTKEPDYTVFDQGSDILKIAYEETADNDGIPSDGDNSGIPGDNPCTGGATENCDDNCPNTPNGPDLGTCISGTIGETCMSDGNCGASGVCSMNQEDTYPPSGNGIGDVCDCEGDFECDGDVDGSNAAAFKADFGRNSFINPCTSGNPCNGDFDCDSDCDGSDAAKFKEDFGRSIFINPCPACIAGDWCGYE